MVRVHINEEDQSLADVDHTWIRQQIDRRRADNIIVCVRFEIQAHDIDLCLATPTCQGLGGSGRRLRPREEEIVDMWRKLGLNENGFASSEAAKFGGFVKDLC